MSKSEKDTTGLEQITEHLDKEGYLKKTDLTELLEGNKNITLPIPHLSKFV